MILYLFDIDGTLLRGATAVHQDSFGVAIREVYGVEGSLAGISAAGRTDAWLLVEALRRAGVPDGAIEERMPRAYAVMERYVAENLGDLRSMVLPGVPETLDGLHAAGGMLALLTGNVEGVGWAKMRSAGLSGYFDVGAFGTESVTRSDLVPAALAKASDQVGQLVLPDRTVLIGDTPLDIEAGRVHGTKTAGVATGPFSEVELKEAGADLVLPSFADVEAAVVGLCRLGRGG
ncbi:MAG TPA: HAD family hydrolase [Chloroflexota bacterium]|nr:HAD family hydrolase [Chloroflexota bacterium]